jgi:hypothetical protein
MGLSGEKKAELAHELGALVLHAMLDNELGQAWQIITQSLTAPDVRMNWEQNTLVRAALNTLVPVIQAAEDAATRPKPEQTMAPNITPE